MEHKSGGVETRASKRKLAEILDPHSTVKDDYEKQLKKLKKSSLAHHPNSPKKNPSRSYLKF